MATVMGYSTTAASNTSAVPDGAPESMKPGDANNVMRALMAALKKSAVAQVVSNWTLRTTGGSGYVYSGLVVPGTGIGDSSARNHRFLIAGASGLLYTSLSGLTWTAHASSTAADIRSIVRVYGSVFRGALSNGKILISPSGGTTSWTEAATGFAVGLNGITADPTGTYIIAVGDAGGTWGNGIIYRSTNSGITWAEVNSGVAQDLKAIAWGPSGSGKVCAVGNAGTVLYSTDNGATFSSVGGFTANNLRAVAMNGAATVRWVTVGESSTIYYSDAPATSWTASGAWPFSNMATFTGVSHDQNQLWCMTGYGTGGIGIASSWDGVTWTARLGGSSGQIHFIAPDSQYQWIAGGTGGNPVQSLRIDL